MKQRATILFLIVLTALALVGCNAGSDEASGSGGLEREQIERIVLDYFTRDPNVPEYEVSVEEVDGDWARVSATEAGVDAEPLVLYLKKEVVGEAPTAAAAAPTAPATQLPAPPTEQPQPATRTAAETGWAIVLGPQTGFSDAELDQAGVPEEVRP